ncbi:MAG: gliding motility-associated C-terminal domain-containing protein [Saprospiraceae bacterium]|nr:gliding motility-associated C-terminal domain-containing protein [Saprospiraceae bacterium]
MANFYLKFFAHKLLTFCFLLLPFLSLANNPGDSTNPDSLANRGHCKAVIEIDTLCGTHEITISAFIYWTFTGVHQPVVVTWSNGLHAHKITVAPPGTWSWDPTGTTCEEYHWANGVTFDLGFFDGPVDLTGPTALCPVDDYVEISNNLNYYSSFTSLVWSPPNPAGDFEPYPVTEPGTYGITVVDVFNCMTSDQITIIEVPIFSPGITGPVRICPEGDTAMLSIVNPALYEFYEWDNGESVSPITVFDPGVYQVTATDSHGCTGVGAYTLQSGAVDPFSISVSSPDLCPGLTDTLQVVGGFASYAWSNNVMGITNIVNQAGTYTVTVTNFFGCTGTMSTTVTPMMPPVIQVLGTPLCLGDTAILTTTGGSFPQYNWSSGQTTQSIAASAPGTYSVTVSGLGICSTSTSLVLDFAAAPTTLIDPAGTLNCLVNQITLHAGNSSSGPTFPVIWTTPDGHFVSGDTTLNPTVDQPGTYILSIVNTVTGCVTNDTVVVIQDIAPPPADAGPSATLNCLLQNFSIGPVPAPVDTNLLPLWSSIDGNILAGNDTWMPGIDQQGTYILLVTNVLNGCTSTASVMIDQDIAPPTAQITPTDLITCMQGTVSLDGSGSSNGPGFTYLWTTANGIIVGPTDTLICGASSIGTYALLVTNTSNGCIATASVTVSADVNLPIIEPLPPNTLTCTVLNTVIDATASSSGPTFQYNWTTLNGNILSGGNTLSPTVDAPGAYTLNLLNTANNCATTLAVVVNQDVTPPIANAGLDAILNCSNPSTMLDGSASSMGPNFKYHWTTANGNIVSGQDSLNPTVDMDGTYELQVTNQVNDCTSTASVVIMNDANAPLALIAAPATLTCATLQTLIDASASTQTGNLTYVWSGNIQSGQGTLQPTVDQPGIYTLSITNNINGCTDVATVTVAQDIVPPTALAGSNGLINCFSPTGSIGDLGNPSGSGFTLQWTTTDGNFISPTNGPTAMIDQAGDYQLLITNTQNGCTATDDVSVAEDFALPSANAGPTAELTCVQTTLILQGTGSTGPNFDYLWSVAAGGNITSGANTLMPVVDAPGMYNLLVTNTQNGCSASSQVSITENANGPVASAGMPQTLNCFFTSTTLSAAGSSIGPLFAYNWSTATGNIVSGANTFTPSIDAPGIYTLTVTNTSNFCTETASVTIMQDIQSPVVNAGADNLLTCVITSLPLQAQITSSSSPSIGYQWSTPNGQILSGGNTANPIIGASGNYSVIVTDNLNGCTSTDQLLISEDVILPTAIIASPLTLSCAVQQVSLNATASSPGANFDYDWTTPSGNFVSIQNPQQPVVDEPGIYNLLITNTFNGCTQTSSVTVPQNVQLPTVEAGAMVGLDCDTQTNTLDGTTSSQGTNFTYTWSTTNGQIISGGNTLTPSIGAPGNYVLTILNTQNGCSNLDNVSVTEDVQHPVLAIAPPQTLTCTITSATIIGSGTALGNPTSILWTTANGNILSGENSLTPTVDAPGNYMLTVMNPTNGCSSTLPVTVTENIQMPPVQVQPSPLLTCAVLQFSLESTVPAQASVVWTTANGHLVSGVNTPYPIVDAPGLYLLSVTSSLNGCTNSAQITVLEEMNVPTGLQFDLEPPLCNGTPGILSVDQVNGGVGPFSYSIDGGQTYFSSEQFNNLTPGNYDLVIQDANDCEVLEPITVPSPLIPLVTAPPTFEIELGEHQEILANVPAPFPISLIDTVIWNPMTGLIFEGNSILQLLNPVAQPFITTQYTVTIFTKEGCKSEARTIVKVDREADIYAPNVIRPDDEDGDNDVFLIFARDESVALIRKLQIFDRWGSLIFANKDFRPNDRSSGWNGDYRGEPVNPAVYVWWAEVELVDGRELLIKGDVTVVR